MKKGIFILIIVLMAGYLGCSSTKREDTVIAKVESKELTVGQFEKVVEVIDRRYLPDSNNIEGKKKILDFMIAKEIMLLQAEKMGYEKDKAVRDFKNAFKGPFLVAAITKYFVRDKVTVDDKEVDEYYEKMKNQFVLSQITVLDSMEALKIREEVLEGLDFAEAARKYSIDKMAVNGGDIGAMPIGGMYWWIEDVLLNAKEGDITMPVRTQDAFSILKVNSRRTISPEQDKEYASKRIRAIKENKMLHSLKRKIVENMGFEIYPEVLDVAFNSLPDDIPIKDIIERKVNYKTAPGLDLRDEYKGMILCQYEGNTYTLADFEYMYDNLDLMGRPRRDQGKEGIVTFMNTKFFNDVLPEYAEKKLKLLENPEVKKIYEDKVERVILTTLYQDAIKGAVQVTQADVDNYYDENKDEILKKEEREYSIVLNADKNVIEKVKELADKEEDFGGLVSNFSEGPDKEINKGKMKMHVKNENSEFDKVAFELPRVGAVSEPFESSRGWAVLRLDKINKKSRVPEEKAKEVVRQTLIERKTDELFNEKVAEWRKDFSVEVYENNLAKARLERTK